MPVSSEQDVAGGGGVLAVSVVLADSLASGCQQMRGVSRCTACRRPSEQADLHYLLSYKMKPREGGWPSVKQAGGGHSALCQGRRLKASVQDETDLGLTCTHCRWRAKYRPK